MMERLGNLFFWLGAAIWIAMITTVAIAAMHAFPTLRDMPMTVEQYANYTGDPHGLLAAGHVMRGIFETTDIGQAIAAGLSVLGAGLGLIGARGVGQRGRLPCALLAATLLAVYWGGVRGETYAALDAKWAAAAAGDHAAAAAATETFDALHQRAERQLRLIGVVVLTMTIAGSLGAPVARRSAAGGRG